ncbi:MAG: DHHA1 domain-containing protein [Eubacteriales bacterium]|nr:DHHA1 domain-containing protein [Eubacteriales bacterium]
MTEKLYYQNIWLDRCEATVCGCEQTKDGYAVLLDRTVIFPEGGGQPSDTGSINGVPVSAAFERGEEIWNCVQTPFCEGDKVEVTLDIERRRDHAQQHSGEHIISGLADKLYGAHNVGFHMAEDYTTLDLDAQLTDEQLAALERAANEVVQRDEPITYAFVHAEDLADIKLRKTAKGLQGEVRIVYIADADSCTCCGTHCKTTGEIGYIRFSSWQNYKGGIRLWFLCGMRAVENAMQTRAIVDAVAKRFSTKTEEVMASVVRQGDELSALKREMKLRTDALLTYRCAALLTAAEKIGDTKLVLHQEERLSAADLKLFTEKLTHTEKSIAVLFSNTGDALLYQIAASPGVKLSMREVCSAVNAATGGRGGGKDDFAQGSAKAQPGMQETMEQLRVYLRAAIKSL